LLRSQSIIGDPGRATGLEVAVEPWRLLETLLERAIVEVASMGADLQVIPKTAHALLVDPSPAAPNATNGFPRWVEPDGVLSRMDGRVAATFEAKYSNRPKREHVYQALSTAAALTSPVAVLVYPWREERLHYEVVGFHGHPLTLATMGVDLFSYRRGSSDRELASAIGGLLRETASRSLESAQDGR
jgi:hypothetical protein